jgi:hypothetical protein
MDGAGTPVERVRSALNGEFRSAQEVAERSGLSVHAVAPCLGHLRRTGDVDFVRGPRGSSLWRASGGEGNGSRSTKRTDALGKDRQVDVQPHPVQSTDSER